MITLSIPFAMELALVTSGEYILFRSQHRMSSATYRSAVSLLQHLRAEGVSIGNMETRVTHTDTLFIWPYSALVVVEPTRLKCFSFVRGDGIDEDGVDWVVLDRMYFATLTGMMPFLKRALCNSCKL